MDILPAVKVRGGRRLAGISNWGCGAWVVTSRSSRYCSAVDSDRAPEQGIRCASPRPCGVGEAAEALREEIAGFCPRWAGAYRRKDPDHPHQRRDARPYRGPPGLADRGPAARTPPSSTPSTWVCLSAGFVGLLAHDYRA